ncbi:phosphonate ABC transporter, permease protein PhnE [Paeniglutamicibacter cryotolerans]|uniref:Phosphonate transport system permease protein n=1 Tax=Paeniglutamicibacter cryotolerans TaxID=670079 RepID=A0A839QGU9_9MICC|nr:phosphonate ABC transporter, permease protein PhnE [Paeniglutamicibacter cryotolerans]MBB2995578.1 phosphonate transport system permease protein [Paeniglutamicibacter cryotolerans]
MSAPVLTLRVPPVPRQGRRAGWIATGLAVFIALHVLALRGTEFDPSLLITGAKGMGSFLADAFPPDLSWSGVLAPALEATLVTLWIGLLGTTLSVPTALLLAVLAARGTSPHPVIYQASRAILSFFRAVPDIVFALIFVTAVGLGPFAGVLALICHNTGVMGKLWAESMEETDNGPQQALSTAGASRLQQVTHASLPMVIPQFVGLLLYRFDVNVRSSLVLGLVGAGGIGLLINQSIKSFQFDAMLTQILVVLVLVIVVDQASAFLRRKLAV